MNKSIILFVLPTLKQDGAEVQISNLLSCFENFKVDIFTFDLFKEGSSIFRDLEGIKVYTKNRNTNLRALKKIIESNEYATFLEQIFTLVYSGLFSKNLNI